jgi:CRISPR-associated exonuclease Cas4
MHYEDKLLPISGLQHLVYCLRQCALIHVEQVWADNELTTSGQVLHQRTNSGIGETRSGNRITRSMDLVSYRLGLVGKADVVEFTPPVGISPIEAQRIARENRGNDGWEGWIITPVEYKRGKQKKSRIWGDCDRVQLCAQALCIEEMLGVTLHFGQLFYGMERRRLHVALDDDLKKKTEELAQQLRDLIHSTQLPPPLRDRRCDRCSLKAHCMPEQVQSPAKASRWLSNQIARHLGDS